MKLLICLFALVLSAQVMADDDVLALDPVPAQSTPEKDTNAEGAIVKPTHGQKEAVREHVSKVKHHGKNKQHKKNKNKIKNKNKKKKANH